MRAAVTGIGAVTALGRGTARLWDAMAAGEQGIARIARFATDGFDVQIAGVVPDRNDPRWADPGAALCIELAVDGHGPCFRALPEGGDGHSWVSFVSLMSASIRSNRPRHSSW